VNCTESRILGAKTNLPQSNPAIAQDYEDGTILMMAWINRQALELTIQTGEIHYWSRSRQELWHKGATSGHIQKLKKYTTTAIGM